MSIWSYLIVPFAWIMQMAMKLLNNYALALIAYALITKIITFPFSMKQQKSSLAMVRLKPYQDELMKKYGSNKERYNMELQKLYEREGYNPMGSCLPMLVQLPLIFLIYSIVRHPITYVAESALFTADTAEKIWGMVQKIGIDNFGGRIVDVFNKIANNSAAVTTVSNYELQIYNKASAAGLVNIPGDKLFGLIDLSGTPSEHFWSWMLLIPILSGATSLLLTVLQQKLNPTQQDAAAGGGAKVMTYMMPLISVWFSYTLTCALGWYWIISNVLGIAQIYILNKMYDPKKVLAEVNEKIEREKQMKKEKRSAAAAKKAAALAEKKKK